MAWAFEAVIRSELFSLIDSCHCLLALNCFELEVFLWSREMYHTAVFREMAAPNICEVGVEEFYLFYFVAI